MLDGFYLIGFRVWNLDGKFLMKNMLMLTKVSVNIHMVTHLFHGHNYLNRV